MAGRGGDTQWLCNIAHRETDSRKAGVYWTAAAGPRLRVTNTSTDRFSSTAAVVFSAPLRRVRAARKWVRIS